MKHTYTISTHENFLQSVKSNLEFIKEFKKNRKTVGSFAPSGDALIRSMIGSGIHTFQSGFRVLEVGSGSGVITGTLFQSLKSTDSLSVVELNELFARRTEEKLDYIADNITEHAHYEVLNEDILKANLEKNSFDLVICSLPFNNFTSDLIDAIFKKILSLTKPGGQVRFFEYLLLRRLKIFFTAGRLKRLSEIEAILTRYIEDYSAEKQLVIRNLPPAMVYTLRKGRPR